MATSSANTTTNGQTIGRVVQIIGPVVDVEFPEKQLPPIYQALRIVSEGFDVPTPIDLIAEVQQHLGENRVRTVSMLPTDGIRAFQSEGEAVGKIQRAKLSSCQLSTYFVGRMAFYRLRQQVQREAGPQFSLGRYHEAVLDQGTLPVKYLPELVRERLTRER